MMALRHVSGGYLEATSNIPALTAYTFCGFFTRKADRNASSCFMLLRNNGTGHFCGAYSDTTDDAVFINQNAGSGATILSLTNDEPFFLAVTINGSGTATGKLSGRNLSSSSMSEVTFDVNADLVGAGILRSGDDSFGSWFDGESNGIIVYSRVLTDAEILRQSKQKYPISRQGLNRWIPEMTTASAAANATDWSGNGYDMTVVGSPTAATGSVKHAWKI